MKRRKHIILSIVILIVIVLTLGIIYYFTNNNSSITIASDVVTTEETLSDETSTSSEDDLLSDIEITIDGTTTYMYTEDTDDVLLNPGKGFTLRVSKDDANVYLGYDGSLDDIVSVIYCRFVWSDIEPEEGEYNWDVIDEVLEDAIEHRQKISIRCYGRSC